MGLRHRTAATGKTPRPAPGWRRLTNGLIGQLKLLMGVPTEPKQHESQFANGAGCLNNLNLKSETIRTTEGSL
jgi:hypothetical protein